jgi:hypothetical protein
MATIDIRNEQLGKVNKIVFANDSGLSGSNWAVDLSLIEGDNFFRSYIRISVESDNNSVGLRRDDVENLIKALQKAVELGWTK